MSRRRLSNPAAGLASRSGELHPVLSAVAFAHHAETTGGATMNVHTGTVAEPGKPGYIVGGQPDRHGQRIPTQYQDVASGTHLGTVMGHRGRIRAQTSDRATSVGYWRDPEVHASPYEVDASSVFNDRRTAKAVGRRRGEKSVWDLQKMDDIRLDGKQRRKSA